MASPSIFGARYDSPHMLSMLYRIFTERKNVDGVEDLLRTHGYDYTMYFCNGAWHGTPESSLIIELTDLPRISVEWLARAIKGLNNQEAVLVQEIPIFSAIL